MKNTILWYIWNTYAQPQRGKEFGSGPYQTFVWRARIDICPPPFKSIFFRVTLLILVHKSTEWLEDLRRLRCLRFEAFSAWARIFSTYSRSALSKLVWRHRDRETDLGSSAVRGMSRIFDAYSKQLQHAWLFTLRVESAKSWMDESSISTDSLLPHVLFLSNYEIILVKSKVYATFFFFLTAGLTAPIKISLQGNTPIGNDRIGK